MTDHSANPLSAGEHPSILTVGVLSAMAVAFAAFWEVLAALCLSGKSYALYALLWTVVLLPFLLYRASKRKTAIYFLFLAALLVLYAVPWNSRKVFLKDFARVREGMTMPEVEAIMGKYMKGTGWPAPPSATSTPKPLTEVGSGTTLMTTVSSEGELTIQDGIVYRHSDDGAFNADFGVVQFKDGKVVSTEFMPD
jgi:hypothetical protein